MKKGLLNIIIYIFFPSIFTLLFVHDINNKNYITVLFISYILLTIYFVYKYRKELKSYISNFKIKDIKKILPFFIIGMLLMILSNYIINYIIIPNGISNNELGNRELLLNNKILYSTLICLIIPFIEETVFRLEFKKSIKNKYIYLITSSLLFALLHIISSTKIIEVLYIVPYFILGLTLSLIYYKTDNIIYNTIAHMLNNIITVIIVLLF